MWSTALTLEQDGGCEPRVDHPCGEGWSVARSLWSEMGRAARSLEQRTWEMPEVNPAQQGLGEPLTECPQMPSGGISANNLLLERALGVAVADAAGSEAPVVLWLMGGPEGTGGKGLTYRTLTVLTLPVLGKPWWWTCPGVFLTPASLCPRHWEVF